MASSLGNNVDTSDISGNDVKLSRDDIVDYSDSGAHDVQLVCGGERILAHRCGIIMIVM